MKRMFFIAPLVVTLSLCSHAATAAVPYGGMKVIPAAGDSFHMGFNADSIIPSGIWSCSVGEHLVKFTYSYYLDSTMVTQADFDSLMGYNPSGHTGNGRYPVENLSWFDAALYCNARSKRDGLDTVYAFTSIVRNGKSCDSLGHLAYDSLLTKNGYRIPTNAEYEYACRAHTNGYYYFAPSWLIAAATSADQDTVNKYSQIYCWNQFNAGGTTHAVATLKPNPFGLYDMKGNCFEWENDFESPYPLTTQIDPIGAAFGDPENVSQCGDFYTTDSLHHKMCYGGSYSDDAVDHERTPYHFHWDDNVTDEQMQISFRCAATVFTTAIEGRANQAPVSPWVSITPGRLSARISYTVQNSCPVSIAIFDCKGRTVRTIVSGTLSVGTHEASWDGRNNLGKRVAAGSYIVSVKMAQQSFSKTLFMAN